MTRSAVGLLVLTKTVLSCKNDSAQQEEVKTTFYCYRWAPITCRIPVLSERGSKANGELPNFQSCRDCEGWVLFNFSILKIMSFLLFVNFVSSVFPRNLARSRISHLAKLWESAGFPHSLSNCYQPIMRSRRYSNCSLAKSLVNISANWFAVSTRTTSIALVWT